ncbi:hypothetical protein [Pseudomonas sp. C32]|uniref:hypothetical protein n=1 Tax=Pseudomonas sp. C32 TaxID=1529208 RepID=UPI0026190E64|nr:hypothetical protein [Pseudomonas sp. C32]MDN4546380.1 hypothetical protein [Pseudomonas sp. C32]
MDSIHNDGRGTRLYTGKLCQFLSFTAQAVVKQEHRALELRALTYRQASITIARGAYPSNRVESFDWQKTADSVEKVDHGFRSRESMRPRLKSLLSGEASGLRFHVAVCKKSVLTSQ